MRLIDADALMMSLADWWYSSFGEQETEEAKAIHAVMDKVEEYLQSSVQLEQSDASEFWRKRADYYSDLCMRLIDEMGKGAKIESVKISENGIEFIKEQPSAQPEIIRCKDCVYWNEWQNTPKSPEYKKCRKLFYTRADDFCSWAERRQDE